MSSTKTKRYKRIRKHMQFYKLSYKIDAPYKIVVDGEFIQACLEGKIMLVEQLLRMMQKPTTIFTTKCVMEDLRKKGKTYSGAIKIGSTLKFLRCRHHNNSNDSNNSSNNGQGYVSSHECFQALIGDNNPEKLIFGAQEQKIRKLVQSHPGIPVIFVFGNVPIMEPPTKRTAADATKQVLSHASLHGEEKKSLMRHLPQALQRHQFKRKKAKGPNPLSMKKKKTNKNKNGAHDNKNNKAANGNSDNDGTSNSNDNDSGSTSREGITGKKRKRRHRKEDKTNAQADNVNNTSSSNQRAGTNNNSNSENDNTHNNSSQLSVGAKECATKKKKTRNRNRNKRRKKENK